MGLFKELVLLPLAPVRGTAWVADQIAEEADRRLYDEDNIKRELVQLEIEADDGEIGPKERAAKEDELLERLAVARDRQRVEQEILEAETWHEEAPEPEMGPTTHNFEARPQDG
jgi:gas vesicle protein GvpG